VKRLLSSRRRRRRAGWIGGVAVVAGALTFVAVHWSNTGKDLSSPFTNEPNQVVAPNPHSVPFTGDTRKQVLKVAAHFIATVVVRRHLDESWDLAAPSLRSGTTHAAWLRGDAPVVPYLAPVAEVKSRLDYDYGNRIGLKIAIFPKAGAKARAESFEIEVKNVAGPSHAKWLVSYWAPAGGQGLPAAPSTDANGKPIEYSPPRGIGAIWLLVPVVLILGSLMCLVVFLVVRGRLRRVRAERAYSSSSSPS
jgi:hypothetical protein